MRAGRFVDAKPIVIVANIALVGLLIAYDRGIMVTCVVYEGCTDAQCLSPGVMNMSESSAVLRSLIVVISKRAEIMVLGHVITLMVM